MTLRQQSIAHGHFLPLALRLWRAHLPQKLTFFQRVSHFPPPWQLHCLFSDSHFMHSTTVDGEGGSVCSCHWILNFPMYTRRMSGKRVSLSLYVHFINIPFFSTHSLPSPFKKSKEKTSAHHWGGYFFKKSNLVSLF